MNLHRRNFLQMAAGAALPTGSSFAWAQDYPTRPVRLVAPFPPGGSVDVFGRLIGQWMSDRLGQPFIIENRPGAGGNLGTEAVVRAPPDGYTLLICTSSNAFNATLYEKLNFNFIRDIAPVASILHARGVLVTHPSLPAGSIPDLIAYAKAHPGEVTMASSGVGGVQHVYGELFKMMTGVDMLHVPYRGTAPAMTDLLAGRVQLMFDTLPTSIEHIKTGKLRALGVTSAARSDVLPDIPAIAEFVPGYDAGSFLGVGAPRDTPTEIIKKLNEEITAGLHDPRIKARISDLGYTAYASSPAEFGEFIVAFTEKWAKVLKFSGAKAD